MQPAQPVRAGSVPVGAPVDAPDGSLARRLEPRVAVWIAAAALAATMAFSAVPTPLYLLYQERFGFSTLTITVIYAAYAFGVIAGLILVGHLSDVHGRRRILLPALIFNAISGAIFLTVPDLGGLLAARIICGFAVGMTTATATAYIIELGQAAATPTRQLTAPGGGDRPSGPAPEGGRFATVAIVANVGGIGLGPLIAGLLAEHAPRPLQLPYLVFVAVLLVLTGLVYASSETVRIPAPKPPYRPQRIVVPPAQRSLYLTACALGLAAFSTYGIINSLVSTLLAGLGEHSRAVAGAVSFVAFAAGATVQALVANQHGPRRDWLAPAALLVPGLAMIAIATWTPNLAIFTTGAALAGAGSGCLFRVALGVAASTAPPGRRAEVLAGFFVAAYIGVSVPAIGMGLALQHWTARTALPGFAIAVVAVVVAGTARIRQQP